MIYHRITSDEERQFRTAIGHWGHTALDPLLCEVFAFMGGLKPMFMFQDEMSVYRVYPTTGPEGKILSLLHIGLDPEPDDPVDGNWYKCTAFKMDIAIAQHFSFFLEEEIPNTYELYVMLAKARDFHRVDPTDVSDDYEEAPDYFRFEGTGALLVLYPQAGGEHYILRVADLKVEKMLKSPADLLKRIHPVDPDKIIQPEGGHDVWTVAWKPPVPDSELFKLRHMDGILVLRDAFAWRPEEDDDWTGWMAVDLKVLIWNKEEIAQ